MREPDAGVNLDPEQARRAGEGHKAMMPVGRPFLDFVLAGLADAGYEEVCLVIGPEHGLIREHYGGAGRPTRIRLRFAVQERPLGTADAVLAAEGFAEAEAFLMVNADNLYPKESLEALRHLAGAGLPGFRKSGLLRDGLIPEERILAFALLEVSPEGYLTRIVEKPAPEVARGFGPDPLVSMNAWKLPPSIFAACRGIAPSVRGELELVDAVRLAMDRGEPFRVLPFDAPVVDLSRRSDVPLVERLLEGREVRL